MCQMQVAGCTARSVTINAYDTCHSTGSIRCVNVMRDAIYVGVRNFDNAPDSIADQLGRRDAEDIFSDWFTVAFDSYADRRTAFAFAVNPRGVLQDPYLCNDEDDDILRVAVWNVAACRDSAGWTAEFRIPLSQLRYDAGPGGAERPWGITFAREIGRHGEESFWAPTPADAPGIVSRFGTLTGFDSLRPASRVELLRDVRMLVADHSRLMGSVPVAPLSRRLRTSRPAAAPASSPGARSVHPPIR